MNSRATQVKIFRATPFALRMSLPQSQPVNCILWPIRTLIWLFAASKLHNDRAPCCTAEWPYCLSLYCDHRYQATELQYIPEHATRQHTI